MRFAICSLVVISACGGAAPPPPSQPASPPDYPEVDADELNARLEAGDPWVPSDKVKTDMSHSGVDVAHLAPRICVDETGAVTWAAMSQPSEFPPLDDELLACVRGFHFLPGPAACTRLEIEYHQR